MTVKELYDFSIKNNLVDAEIVFRTTKDWEYGDYYVAKEVIEKEDYLKGIKSGELVGQDNIIVRDSDKNYSSEQKFIILGNDSCF